MELVDITFWICAVLNIGAVGYSIFYFRNGVKSESIPEAKAKTFYSWFCLGMGFLAGAIIFYSAIVVFKIPVGHGQAPILIASPIFNFLISIVLIVVGRIIIVWKPMKL